MTRYVIDLFVHLRHPGFFRRFYRMLELTRSDQRTIALQQLTSAIPEYLILM